jgi:hypothetical protein
MTLGIGTYRQFGFALLACSAIACETGHIIGSTELGTGGSLGVGGGGTTGGVGLPTGGAALTGGAANTAVETGGALGTGGGLGLGGAAPTGGAFSTGGAMTTGGAMNATGGTSAIGSTTSMPACFAPSPELSLGIYSDPNAHGCACDSAKEADVCVNGVALICSGGIWQAVIDGPCWLMRPAQFSPSGCSLAGGTPIASQGGGITPEEDCPSGTALGIITTELSGWDEGGLCCAPEPNKACGGWVGNTCAQTEYCVYEEGEACGAADAQSVCKPRPFACDDVYTPVCACNGKTYGNACYAAVAGFGVSRTGSCE